MKTRDLRGAAAVLFCGAIMLTACTGGDVVEPMGKSQVEFQMTDSPSDDANIKGIFVTITDIQVDGKSIPGYTTQTVEISAYRDGETRVLGSALIDAKQYSNVTLVLDADTDGAGNSPGSYVLLRDGSKYKLMNSVTKLSMSKDISFAPNSKSTVLIEMDIRKAVKEVEDPLIRYSFVSDAILQKSVRLVPMEETGHVRGTYFGSDIGVTEKIIVFAYNRGSYNAETEVLGQDGVLFTNSVSSAEIKLDFDRNIYKLAYLEAGDYELQFAHYKKVDGSNQFIFDSMLTGGGGAPGDIVTVEKGTTVYVNSNIPL